MMQVERKYAFTLIFFVLCLCLFTAAFTFGGSLSAAAATPEGAALEELINNAPAANRSTVWKYYLTANDQKAAGQYSEAIGNYASAVAYFRTGTEDLGNLDNVINGLRDIAECYAQLQDYNMAAAAWRAAADACGQYVIQSGDNAKIQDQIAYERKANSVEAKTELYLKSYDPAYSDARVYGVPNEPANGTVLGAYAWDDTQVSDPYLGLYWDKFPQRVGKKHGVYLIYFTYGQELSTYRTHIDAAKSHGYAIELAIQPLNGLSSVSLTDGYLVRLAKDMEASGAMFYMRFANEMILTSTVWYAPPEEYIRVFRGVADIFHQNAPSVPVVWAPNDFPPNNINDFYPGDAYVDYVGVSLYMSYLPEIDPLGEGVERRRWTDQLENIYSLYADRKPIIISEGGSPCRSRSGASLESFTAAQITDFYTYLPIRYPNVKLMVWFDAANKASESGISDFRITTSSVIEQAYKQAILSESFLTSPKESASVYYKRLENGYALPEAPAAFCIYAGGIRKAVSVKYSVNGTPVGTVSAAPFECPVDLSAYSGQTVTVTGSVTYEDGATASKSFTLRVGGNTEPIAPPAAQKSIVLTLNSTSASIDGKNVAMDVAPEVTMVNGGGVTFVPIRFVTENLGLTNNWSAAAPNDVVLTGAGFEGKVVIGSVNAVINGATKTLLAAPYINNSRTMVPLRFISENLGYTVSYDAATQTISIK